MKITIRKVIYFVSILSMIAYDLNHYQSQTQLEQINQENRTLQGKGGHDSPVNSVLDPEQGNSERGSNDDTNALLPAPIPPVALPPFLPNLRAIRAGSCLIAFIVMIYLIFCLVKQQMQ